MHLIDSDNAGPGGTWLSSDPMVPRHATRGTPFWFNAVQSELKGVIEAAGLALRSRAADITAGYSSQLLLAINKLNPVRAFGVVSLDGAAGVSIVAGTGKNIASAAIIPSGTNFVRVTFATALSSADYVVVATDRGWLAGRPSGPLHPMAFGSTTAKVDFDLFNSAGAPQNAEATLRVFSFVVLGP